MNKFKTKNETDIKLWKWIKPYISGKKKFSCPDTNALAAYLEGNVSKKQVQTMDTHFTQCPACLDALVELRSILQKEPVKPPVEVIKRAKDLTAASITKKQPVIIKLPVWLSSPNPYVKRYVSIAAAAAVIIASCITGIKFGQDTFDNRRIISLTSLSEMSFGLSGDAGLGFDYLDSSMEADNE